MASGCAPPAGGTGARQHKWFRNIYRLWALKLEAFSPEPLQMGPDLSPKAFLQRVCLKSFQIGFNWRM
jgi:hypothetical protein